jgi:hypothetical protein
MHQRCRPLYAEQFSSDNKCFYINAIFGWYTCTPLQANAVMPEAYAAQLSQHYGIYFVPRIFCFLVCVAVEKVGAVCS